MPSARPDKKLTAAAAALPLEPVREISRPLSVAEYYHACVGTHPHTLETSRDLYLIVEGEGSFDVETWRRALNQAAAINPGARLRLVGKRRKSAWRSDAPLPTLRVIEDCEWDGRSSQGADVITTTQLSLERGHTVELILARRRDGSSFVVLHSLHAVMDGLGIMHLLQEIFRALRGEPLIGGNAAFSDVQLMAAVGGERSKEKTPRTQWLTGVCEGDEIGDEWRRVPLGRNRANLLGRVAAALAEFSHRYSDAPALIAIPVSLRRHLPGLISTTNFSNMLRVRIDKGEGADAFRTRLIGMIKRREDAVYWPILDIIRWLPLTWFDWLVSRRPANYRQRKPVETAVISNLGNVKSADFSFGDFRAHGFFFPPLKGSCFTALCSTDDRAELIINLPRTLSSNGRFDALEAFLRERFAE